MLLKKFYGGNTEGDGKISKCVGPGTCEFHENVQKYSILTKLFRVKRACLYQTQKAMYLFLCELERSGNPRSELSLRIGAQRKSVKRNPRNEFPTVGEILKSIAV
jgi:hypothetical protein